jgi:hypothetical protein
MHDKSQIYVSVAAVMSGRVTSDVEAKPGMWWVEIFGKISAKRVFYLNFFTVCDSLHLGTYDVM